MFALSNSLVCREKGIFQCSPVLFRVNVPLSFITMQKLPRENDPAPSSDSIISMVPATWILHLNIKTIGIVT